MSQDSNRPDYSDLNHCEFGGRLAFDPEQRSTANGKTIVTAKLPVGERRNGTETTLWVKLVAFGAATDALMQFRKGDRIKVRCKVKLSEWTARDGSKRTDLEAMVWEVVAANQQFAPRPERPANQDRPQRQERREEPQRRPEPVSDPGIGYEGDDPIPF